MIRKQLQAGAGRRILTIAAAVVGFACVSLSWMSLRCADINVLAGFQRVAFVAAAFAVTAYNLRVRVVDLVMKLNMSPTATASLTMIARSCGKKLTNLVLLFIISAIAMGLGGFAPMEGRFSWLIASLSAALFAVSSVQFIYVLFAFERLERFILDDAEDQAKEREKNRLLNGK